MKNKRVIMRFLVCQLVEIAGCEFFETVYMSDLENVYLIPSELFDASKKAYKYSEFRLGKGLLAYLV